MKKIVPVIAILIEVGGKDLTTYSKYLISADLGDLCIVPSTWMSENGTGVRGCCKTSATSMLFSKDNLRTLPNISPRIHAATTLPSLFDISFLPNSVLIL